MLRKKTAADSSGYQGAPDYIGGIYHRVVFPRHVGSLIGRWLRFERCAPGVEISNANLYGRGNFAYAGKHHHFLAGCEQCFVYSSRSIRLRTFAGLVASGATPVCVVSPCGSETGVLGTFAGSVYLYDEKGNVYSYHEKAKHG